MIGGRPRIVYVMGYGRSGSTLLDVLLHNARSVTGLGELSHYWTWLERGRSCACGDPLPQCSFWGDVVEDHLARLPHDDLSRWNRDQEAVEGRRALGSLLGERLPEDLVDRYGSAVGGLLAAIAGSVETPAVVDSSGSKGRNAGRVYALARHTAADVRAIHLVRDGRAVAWSSLRGPGSPERPEVRLPRPLKALRAGASWSLANLLCEWVGRRLGSGRVLRVRYEDLVTDPPGQLRRVAEFTDLDLVDLIRRLEEGGPLATGHHVAGNRLRFRDEIRIRPDFSWQTKMSIPYRWVLTANLSPLLLRYGYLGRGPSRAADRPESRRAESGRG